MDFQTNLVNAVGVIGGLGGVGTLFDNVLTTEASRARISEFIRSRRKAGSREDNFLIYLGVINASVFQRYFSAPFLSIRYFLNCVVLSFCSLAIILIVQVSVFGSGYLGDLTLSNTQLLIFAACVGFNLVVDWISIGQTQAFFEISQQQKRASRALLLIASDFILTINFFTMLYAQPLAYAVVAYGLLPEEARLKATIETEAQSVEDIQEKSGLFKFVDKSQPLFATKYLITFPSDGNEAHRFASLKIQSDTTEVSLQDVLHVSERFIRNTTSNQAQYFKVTKGDEKAEQKLFDRRGSSEWQLVADDAENAVEEFEELDLKLPAFALPYSRMMAYTISYAQIDQVQDTFPSSIVGNGPTSLWLGGLESAYQRAVSINDDILGCGRKDKNGRLVWNATTSFENCDARVVIENGQLTSLLDQMVRGQSELDRARIPLNTLFCTSLSMTAMLYFSAFFLAFARLIVQRLIGGVSSAEEYFLKAPFAIVGTLLGMVLYVVSLVI